MTRPTRVERQELALARKAAKARDSWTVRLLGQASELADQPPLIAICTATLAVGVIARRPRLALAGARMLAGELLATKLKSMIKHRVDRSRPEHAIDGPGYVRRKGASHDHALNSFPSGHTAGAVAVARAVARSYPRHADGAYATAGAVAAIQVPRSTHYPSDLAAGAAIGLAADAIVQAGEAALGSAHRRWKAR